jgi:DNA-binding NtrC family response regulator
MDKNLRVLIIDDDKVIRETLAFTLEDEGYTVDTAETGKEAIEKTNSEFYNLAIVDWRLPDFEGTKLLRELKATTPRMVKIMLTGYPSMNNAIDAVNEHADAFLTKPVAIDELLLKMEQLLDLQKRENEYGQEKVAEFIEAKTRQALSSMKEQSQEG